MTKKRKGGLVFWGIAFILAGIAIILGGLNIGFLGGTVGMVQIALGILLIALSAKFAANGDYELIPITLSLLFLVFERAISYLMFGEIRDLITDWILLLAAVLFAFGIGTLLRAGRSAKREKGIFSKPASIGSSTLYFDAANLSDAVITDTVGELNAYVTNRAAYTGSGVIRVCDFCGNAKIHLPSDWLVMTTSSDCVAKIRVPQQEDRFYPKTITIAANSCCGNIEVIFD